MPHRPLEAKAAVPLAEARRLQREHARGEIAATPASADAAAWLETPR